MTNDTVQQAALIKFGEMMRLCRQSRVITTYFMSEKTGLSPSQINAVERGDITATESECERIAEFLGYDVDTFSKVRAQIALASAKTNPSIKAASGTDNQPVGNIVNLNRYRKSKWPTTPTLDGD